MDIIDINTTFGAYPGQLMHTGEDGLLTALKDNGVTRALTLATAGIFYNDMTGNLETMRTCLKHEDKMIPVATINPTSNRSLQITQDLAMQPFAFFQFFPSKQGWPVDFAPFVQVVRMLGDAGKPLLERSIKLPTPSRGWKIWADGGEALMVSIDKPGDATHLGKVVADYPGSVIIDGVSGATLTETLSVMHQHDNLYVETHMLHTPDALSILRDSVGIRRVLFGSGAPGLSLPAALAYVLGSGLSDVDKRAVLFENANSLLHGN